MKHITTVWISDIIIWPYWTILDHVVIMRILLWHPLESFSHLQPKSSYIHLFTQLCQTTPNSDSRKLIETIQNIQKHLITLYNFYNTQFVYNFTLFHYILLALSCTICSSLWEVQPVTKSHENVLPASTRRASQQALIKHATKMWMCAPTDPQSSVLRYLGFIRCMLCESLCSSAILKACAGIPAVNMDEWSTQKAPHFTHRWWLWWWMLHLFRRCRQSSEGSTACWL